MLIVAFSGGLFSSVADAGSRLAARIAVIRCRSLDRRGDRAVRSERIRHGHRTGHDTHDVIGFENDIPLKCIKESV